MASPRASVIGSVAVVIVAIVGIFPLARTGPRPTTTVEAVTGIPFPRLDNATHIAENLAHFDVMLVEPVVAKELVLTITYTPLTAERLAVGVRENDFWLSYTPVTFYEASDAETVADPHSATVRLPLTDKIQDSDRSVDVMLFAHVPGLPLVSHISDPTEQTTHWKLHDVTAATELVPPTLPQLKEYVRSVVERERPL